MDVGANASEKGSSSAGGSSSQAATIQQQVNGTGQKQQQEAAAAAAVLAGEEPAEKLLITGDDVLIEYVTRLIIAVKSFTEGSLRNNWRLAMESFITHYVWHTSDMRRADNNK